MMFPVRNTTEPCLHVILMTLNSGDFLTCVPLLVLMQGAQADHLLRTFPAEWESRLPFFIEAWYRDAPEGISTFEEEKE